MNRQQLQDELSLLIIRTTIKGKPELLETAEANGITFLQAMALCLLVPGQPVPMNKLSTYIGCDPSGLTGVVERLVSCAFIERKESPKDRRIKTVTLTADGEALRAEFLRVAGEKRLPNLDALTSSEGAELMRLLQKATTKPSAE